MLTDKQKKSLDDRLETSIEVCQGTMELVIVCRSEEEEAYLKKAMKGRRKVKTISTRVE